MFYRIIRKLVHYPLLSVAGSLLFVAITSFGLTKLTPNFDFKLWFKSTDQALLDYEEYEREFGNDDNIIVIVHSPSGIFDTETAELIKNLTSDLAKIPDVERVDSLSNFPLIIGRSGELEVENAIPSSKEDFLKERKDQIARNDNVVNYLTNKDLNTTLLTAQLKPLYQDKEQYKKPVEQARKLIQSYEGRGDHTFHLSGSAVVTQANREVSESDIHFLMPLLVFLTMVLMYGIFRSLSISLLIGALYGLAIVSTMGLAGWFGISFSNLTACVPQILIAITLADSIHLMQSFVRSRAAGMSRFQAAEHAFEESGYPTFMTSLTTGLGFAAFIISDIVSIQELGILCSVGVVIAWAITAATLPCLFLYFPIPVPRNVEKKTVSRRSFITNYVDWVARHKYKVIASWSALLLASMYVNSKNVIDADLMNYFSEELEIKKSYRFMQDKFGGARTIDLVVDSGKDDGIKNIDFLAQATELQKWMDAQDHVVKTTSIANILGEINQAIKARNIEKYSRLPASTEAVSQQLLLYTISLPENTGVENWISANYRKILIRVFWDVENSSATIQKINEIKEKAKELGLSLKIAGKSSLVPAMSDHIINTFNDANSYALVMILITMILLCRSVRLGSLAMMPNAIPPVFAGGVMYIMGVNYDVGTVLVMCVVMGIAVDDTVHFMTHFQENVKNGMDYRESIIEVFDKTGQSLLITNGVLSIGFGIAIWADFLPFRNFGLMTIISLTFALVADWMLLPALLMTPYVGFHPKKKAPTP